jgi:hypothetical protein
MSVTSELSGVKDLSMYGVSVACLAGDTPPSHFCMQRGLHIKYLLLWSNFNQNWNVSAAICNSEFCNSELVNISLKIVSVIKV